MGSDTDFRLDDAKEYDEEAKDEAIELLKFMFPDADRVGKNTDKYGIDIFVDWRGRRLWFEVEYKNFRDFGRIMNDGIHIATRKMKFYESQSRANHITFLNNYDRAIVIKNRFLVNTKIITKSCSRRGDHYDGAKFLAVDYKNFMIYEKDCGLWEKTKGH